MGRRRSVKNIACCTSTIHAAVHGTKSSLQTQETKITIGSTEIFSATGWWCQSGTVL